MALLTEVCSAVGPQLPADKDGMQKHIANCESQVPSHRRVENASPSDAFPTKPCCMFDNVYIIVSDEILGCSPDSSFHYFSIEGVLKYIGFCDDFGPMSLGTIHEFCKIMERELRCTLSNKSLALQCPSNGKSLTNAAFLMGAYMIMKRDDDVATVMQALEPLLPCILTYRDVSPGVQTFHLHLADCLGGLHKAKRFGWVRFDNCGFDPEQYAHYDDPLNADLHEIIPNKFVAMRGPVPLPNGMLYRDEAGGDGGFSHRDFSPAHYAPILARFGVRAVVRLNEPTYDAHPFAAQGIAMADLYFDDCAAPPPEVVAKFLTLADGLPGAMAVHCRAGLGRTGTLIALYMMKNHDFAAREAIGWLRIVRPGSVIGTQQQFLVAKEPLLRRHGPARRPPAGAPCPARVADCAPAAGAAELARFISDICRRVDTQARSFRDTGRAPSRSEGPGSRRGSGVSDPARAGIQVAPPEADSDAPAGLTAAALAAHVSRVVDRRSGARAGGRRPQP